MNTKAKCSCGFEYATYNPSQYAVGGNGGGGSLIHDCNEYRKIASIVKQTIEATLKANKPDGSEEDEYTQGEVIRLQSMTSTSLIAELECMRGSSSYSEYPKIWEDGFNYCKSSAIWRAKSHALVEEDAIRKDERGKSRYAIADEVENYTYHERCKGVVGGIAFLIRNGGSK